MTRRRRRDQIVVLVMLWAAWMGLGVPAALAQRAGETPRGLEDVGVEEQLGETLAKDVVLRNEQGEAVRLGSYFDGETPVILTLVYHDCPMLCNLILDGFTGALREMAWTPGGKYEVLTVSFNAAETPEMARRQKERYVEALGRPEAAEGWHFLTGDEEAIATLTESVGFSFRWVEQQQEFAHPATLLFLGGDGMITRYLYGLEYAPGDVRKALVEASNGEIGTPVDQLILFCFQYDPDANSYVLHAFNAMRVAGILTVLVLGLALFMFWRREGRALDGPASVPSSS